MSESLKLDAYAYDLAVLDQQGRMLHVPHGAMTWEEQPSELSATLRFNLPNVMTTEGPMLALVGAGTPVYLSVIEKAAGDVGIKTANAALAGTAWDPGTGGTLGGFIGGTGRVEVMRGTIIEVAGSTHDLALQCVAYDVLHTLLKHDVDAYIPAGTSFIDALTGLAAERGMSVGKVDGPPKAGLGENTGRGQEAGPVLAAMLEQVMLDGHGQYVLRATGDQLEVVSPGANDPTYELGSPPTGSGAGVTDWSVSIANL